MGRRLRFIPPGGALVEVTCRTLQGRFLLTPRPDLNEIVVGVLARAKRRYPLDVCAVVFLSNHFHLLLFVEDVQQLARFMTYVGSNVAREVARLTGWRDKVWGRRYQAIVVSDEEAAQVGRLEYLLAHGCKEGLVRRLRDWPGVHCVRALCLGDSLEGVWFDRTRQNRAKRRGKLAPSSDFAQRESLTLAPLPCWRHLSEGERCARAVEIVSRIEAPAGIDAPSDFRPARRPRHPFDRPRRLDRSPAPSFHAFSRAVRAKLDQAYAFFFAAFRQAAERLRLGDRTAKFPSGSFPPRLPFERPTLAVI